LPKRLSHDYWTNLALPSWDDRCKSIPGLSALSPTLTARAQLQLGYFYLLGCMTHTAPSYSCFLAPDINTLTNLLTLRHQD